MDSPAGDGKRCEGVLMMVGTYGLAYLMEYSFLMREYWVYMEALALWGHDTQGKQNRSI